MMSLASLIMICCDKHSLTFVSFGGSVMQWRKLFHSSSFHQIKDEFICCSFSIAVVNVNRELHFIWPILISSVWKTPFSHKDSLQDGWEASVRSFIDLWPEVLHNRPSLICFRHTFSRSFLWFKGAPHNCWPSAALAWNFIWKVWIRIWCWDSVLLSALKSLQTCPSEECFGRRDVTFNVKI